jgi:hypothetical protein
MGLLGRLLRKSQPPSGKLLEDSITRLRVGLFARLWKRYTPAYGGDQAKFMSVAILNEALAEEPTSQEAGLFRSRNGDLISREAMTLTLDTQMAQGLSYLYAAQTLLLVFMTRNPFSEAAQLLCQRANDLKIYIPNTYDICGSGDAQDCILAISAFSISFLNESKP